MNAKEIQRLLDEQDEKRRRGFLVQSAFWIAGGISAAITVTLVWWIFF
jgi:hypothetical protein